MPDGYLGLLLAQPGGAAEAVGVLVVAPAALLHPSVPQPDGAVLYELVTGHPDRAARELVFPPELTMELRAWPADTWSKVGIDPQAAARAVVAGRQRGDLLGLQLGGLTAEEALAWCGRPWPWCGPGFGAGSPANSAGLTGGGGTQAADTSTTTISSSSGHSVRSVRQPSGLPVMVPETAADRDAGVSDTAANLDTWLAAMPARDDGRPPQDCGGTSGRHPAFGVSGRRTRCLLVGAGNQDRPARSAATEGPDTPDSGRGLRTPIIRTAR